MIDNTAIHLQTIEELLKRLEKTTDVAWELFSALKFGPPLSQQEEQRAAKFLNTQTTDRLDLQEILVKQWQVHGREHAQ